MKGFWIGFGAGVFVGLFVLTVVVLLFAAFNNVSVVGSGHAGTIARTNSAGKLAVIFGGEHGHSIIFSRGVDTYTFTSATNEQCFQSIESADGKSALVLMNEEMNFGYNYACLMRFDFSNNALAKVEPERILNEKQLSYLLGTSRAWVNDLYKFSPSGDRVLLGLSSYPVGTKRALWYNFTSNDLEEP